MRALDTNVVIRFLRRDDERQSSVADEILASPCFVPITVLLEAAWVLVSSFKVPRKELAQVLGDFLDLSTVHTDDLSLTHWAVRQYRDGADLADMLHLIASRGVTHFATFDRKLAKRAGSNPPVAVETLR